MHRARAAIKVTCQQVEVADLEPIGEVLVAIAILVGLVGIVVAAIPGLILIWGAVLVWALVEQTGTGWFVLGLATVLTVAGQVVKYLIPGRRLRDAGIPGRSILAGAILSIVGLFLIPLVGFIIGFVLGVYLAERYRLGSHAQAWPSTKRAMSAAGMSILIELVAGLAIAGSWALAVTVL
ncbi:MAG TPA: DUF456 domain-containing protein [Acidimicrobiia bacterium]|nr:DUF456 domain-containing protein [Acidimicrobiia bacterium]